MQILIIEYLGCAKEEYISYTRWWIWYLYADYTYCVY